MEPSVQEEKVVVIIDSENLFYSFQGFLLREEISLEDDSNGEKLRIDHAKLVDRLRLVDYDQLEEVPVSPEEKAKRPKKAGPEGPIVVNYHNLVKKVKRPLYKAFYLYSEPLPPQTDDPDELRQFTSTKRKIDGVAKALGFNSIATIGCPRKLRKFPLPKLFKQKLISLGVDPKELDGVPIALSNVDTIIYNLVYQLYLDRFENNITTVILVSGDKDFVPLIKGLNGKGFKFEICASVDTVADDIIKLGCRFIDLGRIVEDILMDSSSADPKILDPDRIRIILAESLTKIGLSQNTVKAFQGKGKYNLQAVVDYLQGQFSSTKEAKKLIGEEEVQEVVDRIQSLGIKI